VIFISVRAVMAANTSFGSCRDVDEDEGEDEDEAVWNPAAAAEPIAVPERATALVIEPRASTSSDTS
jgi:hypothetical protein